MTTAGVEPPRIAAKDIFREAGLTALVSLALLIPVVGFRIANRGGDQFLETRWPEVAIAVALIFFGRMFLILIRDGRLAIPITGGVVIAAIGWLTRPTPAVAMSSGARSVIVGAVASCRNVAVRDAPRLSARSRTASTTSVYTPSSDRLA